VGGDSNPHIERTTPGQQVVAVAGRDLRDISILAFRRMNQMDLSGNVITDHTNLPFLKVCYFAGYSRLDINVLNHLSIWQV
jgi:hypothetical protein